jgi:hypothetical protein
MRWARLLVFQGNAAILDVLVLPMETAGYRLKSRNHHVDCDEWLGAPDKLRNGIRKIGLGLTLNGLRKNP